MKKTLLLITAILAMTASVSANTGINDATYYNNNKSEWTLSVGTLGNVLYAWNDPITGFIAEKVACNNERNMCYTAPEAKRAFGFDLAKFERGQIVATAEKPVWMYLNELLK